MSYTSPEAVSYFNNLNSVSQENNQYDKPMSKYSRIASNQMTLVSLN